MGGSFLATPHPMHCNFCRVIKVVALREFIFVGMGKSDIQYRAVGKKFIVGRPYIGETASLGTLPQNR